jgi:hypothetical protein
MPVLLSNRFSRVISTRKIRVPSVNSAKALVSVIPAKAGIQGLSLSREPGFRPPPEWLEITVTLAGFFFV